MARKTRECRILLHCGADIHPHEHRRHRHMAYERERNECFGIPGGGIIVGLIVGIILIIVGLSSIFGIAIDKYFGAIILVIVGILIIVGAFFGLRRKMGS
ncbi:MAG: zinc ribbon domain-containing protein [Euryarchaeota archaeon]|nr:zinc ribbon domain-containing protein [Euryarchaeota archaeon]